MEKEDLIAVERYKFILEKIKYLDTLHQSHISFIYKAVTALVSFMVLVLFTGLENKIEHGTVLFAIRFIGLSLVFICVVFLAMSKAVINSWIDYRLEEVELISQVDTVITRNPPTSKFKWRWNEAQFMILLLLIALIGLFVFLYPGLIVEFSGIKY